jgi:hypothetical protein
MNIPDEVFQPADKTHCVECGCELTKDEIESGGELCFACYTWHQDYADLDADA